MAGKRHHFIPRFLQSGFASHVVGDSVFAWVFRAQKKPFNTNIINIGVEGQFYSNGDDNEVDDLITEAEAGFSRLVTSLRTNREAAIFNAGAIGELIAHLEIRTRQLREGFVDLAEALSSEILSFIEDEQRLGEYLRRKFEKEPGYLDNMLKEELEKSGVPGHLSEEAAKLLKPLAEQLIPAFVTGIKSHAAMYKEQVLSKMRDAAKKGHLKALRESVAPNRKKEIYQNFNYQVYFFDEGFLPLGDSIVFFETLGERRFKPFADSTDLLESIYLPLSSKSILVGRRQHKAGADLILEEISSAIVGCSREWFICASEIIEEDLQKDIGKFSHILTNEDVDNLLSEVFDSH